MSGDTKSNTNLKDRFFTVIFIAFVLKLFFMTAVDTHVISFEAFLGTLPGARLPQQTFPALGFNAREQWYLL